MKAVGICGHFGTGKNLVNGQTIKAKIVTEELERQLGKTQVLRMDSHGGAKAFPRMAVQCLKMFCECENVIMLPAHKGLRIFTPLFSFYNLFFHRKLYYFVVGGWLEGHLQKYPSLEKQLKKFTAICVETTTMKHALEKRGFANVIVLPNCKDLPQLSLSDLPIFHSRPLPVCTFSRVMKEKGIEDIATAIQKINDQLGCTAYTLDIYGAVDKGYEEAFAALQASFPPYIRYRGIVDFDKSTSVLKQYFAMIFPTRFYTEGVPGTIIDGYAAGLPVISSRWESFSDVIEEGATGFGYPFENTDALEALLREMAESPEKMNALRQNCLEKSRTYHPKSVIGSFVRKYLK